MSMRCIKKGSADQSVVIRIIDSSDGTPETSVDYNTSGIDLWYRREGATKTSITEATLASLDAAHSDGGIEPIGDGYYRLDLPDAAVATGANGVMVGGTVTGMIVIGCYVHLVDYDPQDAVRIGITALPNAAADAAGGLPISDAGALDLDAKIGALTFTVAGDVDVNIQSIAGAALNTSSAQIGVNVVNAAGTAWGSGAITESAIANNAITAAKIANGAIDNATFAADVGSTAYATNIIALAADKAIQNYDAPTNTEMVSAFTEIKGATWSAATDTIEHIRDKLPANLEDMSITDTTGLVDITQTAADKAWGTAARVLTANTNLNDPTAASIADAVWDEASTGHTDAGKAGQQLWTDVDAVLADTNELQSNQGNWLTATGFSTHSAADVWSATNATLSLTYAVITSRLYRFLMNKMNITDATGAVALRNEADGADLATQTITDNDTTTTRTALTWA